MKTPMQELIEQLKEERDQPLCDDSWLVDRVLKAESHLLEKEKEFMQKVYANAKATGEMDEAVRTFNN